MTLANKGRARQKGKGKGVAGFSNISNQMPVTFAYLTGLGMDDATASEIIKQVIIDSEGWMIDVDLNKYEPVRELHKKIFGVNGSRV